MSAVIDSNPSLIIPDNQPLIFTIGYATSLPERYIVQVEEDGVEIAKLYLTPNTNDKAHFDLSEVVRERVKVDDKIRDESATLHSYSALPFTTGREGLKKYQVKVGSFSGGSETLNEASAIVYLLDGAEQISAGLHPSFADYYSTSSSKKVWLTDRVNTSGKIILEASEDDEGVIAFLNDSSIISGGATEIRYLLYAGGTLLQSATYQIDVANGAQLPAASDNNQKLTYLGIMPKNLEGYLVLADRPSENPTWTHYEMQIWGTTRKGIPIRINKICRAVKHENTQLAWTNSKGGWDYLLFTGRTETTDMTSSKPFKKQLGNWDASTYTYLPEARESQPYQMTASTKFKLNRLDFPFADIALLKNCLRSDNVMIRQGSTGDWQPVNLDTKSYNVKEAFSGLFSVSLTLTLAQTVKC